MEGWVSPGPLCKEQLAHDCPRPALDSNPRPRGRWSSALATRLSRTFPPFRSKPLNIARRSGECYKRDLGQSPIGKRSNLVHFSLKIWHWSLVAPILLIFLTFNEHVGQLVGPNALWPTQAKFWVGHGPPGPPCSAPCDLMVRRDTRLFANRSNYSLH